VDVEVRRGEIVTLIGLNGSGKTSLVRVILGLTAPSAGRVRRPPGLRVGYMPQRLHVDSILPLSVRRFLLLGGRRSEARLQATLKEVGALHVMEHPIQAISGGELQRVLLARALLRDPDLLVLDEPVQGVDINGQIDLYELISRIRDRHGCGILMVSHDLHLVMAATDHVVCLNQHVCCSGSPDAVSRDPAYLGLFGTVTGKLAVYTHRHNHAHDLHGNIVPEVETRQGDKGSSDG
jgi:zinc transport system ATP-binding protein